MAGLAVAGAAIVGAAGCSTPVNPFRRRPDMNVVLILIDSLRNDHVGAYGGTRAKTPYIDALAKDSLRFTRAYPECMPPLPARRTVYTGRRTFPFDAYSTQENGSALMYGWLPIPDGQSTLSGASRKQRSFP